MFCRNAVCTFVSKNFSWRQKMSELWLKTWFWSGSATGVHFQKRALFSAPVARTGTYLLLLDSSGSADSSGMRIVRLGCSSAQRQQQNEGYVREVENSRFLLGRFRKTAISQPLLGQIECNFHRSASNRLYYSKVHSAQNGQTIVYETLSGSSSERKSAFLKSFKADCFNSK